MPLRETKRGITLHLSSISEKFYVLNDAFHSPFVRRRAFHGNTYRVTSACFVRLFLIFASFDSREYYTLSLSLSLSLSVSLSRTVITVVFDVLLI